MKIVILEMTMNHVHDQPMAIPSTQSRVVQFDGNFDEYKSMERESATIKEEGVEITGIGESEDEGLVIDYVVRRHGTEHAIRQMHFVPYGLHGEESF